MQFVHHQIAKRAQLVVPPKRRIDRPREQQIQHLVVGEQDVGRLFPQRIAVFDEMLPSHARSRGRAVLTDVQARTHSTFERRRAVNRLRNAARLVGRERVHRVDDDRLDARLARLRTAMVEDGIDETLRLAGAGTRGDHRGLPLAQLIEGDPLVPMRRESERYLWERLAAFRGRMERQIQRQVRTLREVVTIRQEVVDDAGQRRIRWRETGA